MNATPPVWPEYDVPLDPLLAWTPIDLNAPIAYVKLVTVRGVRQWRVARCPYCGKAHTHGAGERHEDPRAYLGGRWAHCDGDEYRLVPIEKKPVQ